MKLPAIAVNNLSSSESLELIKLSRNIFKEPTVYYINEDSEVCNSHMDVTVFKVGYRSQYEIVDTYEEFINKWEQIKLMNLL